MEVAGYYETFILDYETAVLYVPSMVDKTASSERLVPVY